MGIQVAEVSLVVIGSQEIAELSPFVNFREENVSHEGPRVALGELNGVPVALLGRSAKGSPTLPHLVDYAAIIETAKSLGAKQIVSTNMVGSLRPSLHVGHKTLVTQFLDFTKYRSATSQHSRSGEFIDVTDPFCSEMNRVLGEAAARIAQQLAPAACYVATDGPRFETRAEVAMYGLLGGDIIGMTLVQEAVFAREHRIRIASLAGVVNFGAGLATDTLRAEDFLAPRRSIAEDFASLIEQAAPGIAALGPMDGWDRG